MALDRLQRTRVPPLRGFLVGIALKSLPASRTDGIHFNIDDSLDELAQLARTAYVDVVGGTYQRVDDIQPATLIGQGKLEELQAYRDELGIDVFLFDEELSPRQLKELERALGTQVIDRTALILDIFARHARTKEGQLQVELAQYEYRLPRLTRMWTHLARQAGGRAGGATGGVGVRGPGETQLEVDRREIRRRIAHLKRELEGVRRHRSQHRKRRRQAGLPVVAIVGYTNAGKSTLLNTLSGSHVLQADMLFATLDPTTRSVALPGGRQCLFSDTVGFIQKLPTHLVAAFRATLEEINEADIILHVVDITHRNALEQAAAVEQVLREIGATQAPVLVALNKIDKLQNRDHLAGLLDGFPNSVPISATEKLGIEDLLQRVQEVLETQLVEVEVLLPHKHGDLFSLVHRYGTIEFEEYTASGIYLRARVPKAIASDYEDFTAPRR